MEADLDRIKTAKNRVFYSDGIGLGKNNPISLHTSKDSIYRITGLNQIADIINCGYVRPREGKLKGGHVNEVFWSVGGKKTFYYDKRPVLETAYDKVKEGQIGALSLDDLTAIWMFDETKNCYLNNIDEIKQLRESVLNKGIEITKEDIEEKQRELQLRSKELMDMFEQEYSNEHDMEKML